jgi:hypothetical protein
METRPHVRVNHPLIGSRPVRAIIQRQVFQVGNYSLQIAKNDVSFLQVFRRVLECRVWIRTLHVDIANQRYFYVCIAHKSPSVFWILGNRSFVISSPKF